jgi:hypothetical protein
VWEPDDPLSILPAETFENLRRDGTRLKLWLVGYVDYTDRFQRRFRNYYTRQSTERNNLLIETQDGYNTEISLRRDGRP